jgi:hypothetical protein
VIKGFNQRSQGAKSGLYGGCPDGHCCNVNRYWRWDLHLLFCARFEEGQQSMDRGIRRETTSCESQSDCFEDYVCVILWCERLSRSNPCNRTY